MSDRSEKFFGKYRNASARLPGWDYTSAGNYFVTICTRERMPWFGNVTNGVMRLSTVGLVVRDFWKNIPAIYPNVALDVFIVMPDHLHGILVLHHEHLPVTRMSVVGTPHWGVPTDNRQSDHRKPQWRKGSVGSIINQFKGTCTKHIRSMGHPDFGWQPRFHDEMLRTKRDMNRVRRYIWDNPRNWQNDVVMGTPLVVGAPAVAGGSVVGSPHWGDPTDNKQSQTKKS